MSMVVYLRRASADEVANVQENPETVDSVVFADGAADRVIDFDKAWHALHFMLTGCSGSTTHPLSLLVASDAELKGTDEFGLGGYWLAEPDRVSSFATALSEISDDTIASRYDPVAMSTEHIYLSDVFKEDGAEALTYVLQGLAGLRRLCTLASRDGDCIIGVLR